MVRLLAVVCSLLLVGAAAPVTATDNARSRRHRTIFISDTHLGTRGCNAALLIDFGELETAVTDALFPSADAPFTYRVRDAEDVTVVAVCNGCHDINRARAGYTPAGWNMLQHMMQNFEAPIPPEDWPVIARL